MTSLDTFIPPPVLPAHAPENINMTKIIFENSGHLLKSVDAYPVAVSYTHLTLPTKLEV